METVNLREGEGNCWSSPEIALGFVGDFREATCRRPTFCFFYGFSIGKNKKARPKYLCWNIGVWLGRKSYEILITEIVDKPKKKVVTKAEK